MTLGDVENIQPDEKGIIKLVIEGMERKFIKDKLLDYLRIREGVNVGVKAKQEPRRRGRPRLFRIKPAKKEIGSHKRTAVIAILPDGTEKLFISCTAAAAELRIDKTNIPHVLSGRYKHVYGIRFKLPDQNKIA